MNIEKSILTALAGVIAVSSGMSYVRTQEERARRLGIKGTSVLLDQEGSSIEYLYSEAETTSRTTLVLENGLGAPLECWDWIRYLLSDDFNILCYHRSGYARTDSRARPGQLLEALLQHCSPQGPIVFCSHSIGSLVTGNALAESEYLRNRARAVVVLDGTDAVLLDADRRSRRRVERFKQDSLRRMLGTVTGMNRWVTSPPERDVEYRPDIQRAYVSFIGSIRTIRTAQQEYLHEPTEGQEFLAALDLERVVLSAADNVDQQQTLADRLNARFQAVSLSSHRSIIGKLPCAEQVATVLKEMR